MNLVRENLRNWSKIFPPLKEPVWKIVIHVGLEIDQPRVLEFVVLMPKNLGPGIHIVSISITYRFKRFKKKFELIQVVYKMSGL